MYSEQAHYVYLVFAGNWVMDGQYSIDFVIQDEKPNVQLLDVDSSASINITLVESLHERNHIFELDGIGKISSGNNSTLYGQ